MITDITRRATFRLIRMALVCAVTNIGAASLHAALEAPGATEESVTLSWTAVGDDDNLGTATVYDIRYSLSPITDANWSAATQVSGEPTPQPAGSAESFTVSGLDPGTTYYFAVKVGDEIPNWSPLSNVVTKTTNTETTPPALIANLAGSALSESSINLTWTAPGDDGTTGTASQYDLRYSTSPITASNFSSATAVSGEPTPSPAGSSESHTVTGLQPSTTYYFAIRTADEVPNWSGISNVPNVTTQAESTPPATVANLGVSSAASTSLTLTWTAPGDDGSSGTATTYDIRYSTSSISNSSQWNNATQVSGEPSPKSAGSSESFTVSSLNPNTTYYFALKTADEVPNWSGMSNVPNGTTSDETTPPATIANLGAGSETDKSITLTWTAPGDDGNSGTASGYDIRYSTAPITSSNFSSATAVASPPAPKSPGSAESIVVGSLNSSTTYYFAVKTVDDAGNWSAMSNVASRATTQDQTPPRGINDLSAVTGGAAGELALEWTAPGDDGDQGRATGYVIGYANFELNDFNFDRAFFYGSSPTPVEAGQKQEYVLSGLNPGQTYWVGVKAVDEAGNVSVTSNSVSAMAGFDIGTDVNDGFATLQSPINGATMPTARPYLTIENTLPTVVDQYVFEVATDSNFVGLVTAAIVDEEPGTITAWRVDETLESERIYYWRVRSDAGYSETSSFQVSPQTHAYPNPFHADVSSNVTFTDLPTGEELVLTTVSGEIVRSWELSADELVWDGTNDAGRQVASGVYLWFLADSGTRGKIVVVR